VDGILLLDKPRGITSHDAVARARRALGTRKVGHAGTLDPMATGLLLLGAGPSTRLLTHLVGLDKEYTATIRLGQATTTDDAEGEIVAAHPTRAVTAAAIAAGVAALTGEISQRPSSVSAIKVDGVRAYDRVRAGEDVELAARRVTVSAFEVLETRGLAAPAATGRPVGPGSAPRGEAATPRGAAPSGHPEPGVELDVRVECSSGTYIRALARDLGAALGVGGHLTALRRTRVGPFRVEEAQPVPGWGERLAVEPITAAETAARLFPLLRLDAAQAADLANGKRIAVAHPDADTAAALAPDGRLVGLVAVADGRTRVLTNFPTPAAQED